jgi:hypothetical protein
LSRLQSPEAVCRDISSTSMNLALIRTALSSQIWRPRAGEAMLSAREMLAERIILGAEATPLRILITDAAGNLLAVVHMRDVLPRALWNCKD